MTTQEDFSHSGSILESILGDAPGYDSPPYTVAGVMAGDQGERGPLPPATEPLGARLRVVDHVEDWPRMWEGAQGGLSDLEGSMQARQAGVRSREQKEWISDVRNHPVLTQGGGDRLPSPHRGSTLTESQERSTS